MLVLGFGHWALGSGLLVLGFWHLRAMPLGSGVSDPIPVLLFRCPWFLAFGSRLSLFGDRFSAFGYRHCDLGSWLWALISGLGALGFRPWDLVSRVLGHGALVCLLQLHP